MIHSLYWVSALVLAMILMIILVHDIVTKTEINREEKAFRLLLRWVIFFCLQDTFWGICGGSLVQSDLLFSISSTIFHLSTVTTTFFWLYYVLTYLSDRIKHPKRILAADGIVVLFQIILLIININKPTIFSIQNGEYITAYLRPLAFFNQYVVYLLISLITAFHTFSAETKQKKTYFTVFMFSLAPVLSGVFQLLYPDGPFYSIGYFMGCFIIHIFVVSKDRQDLEQLSAEAKIAKQIEIANTDELTGLRNRRAYEDDIISYENYPAEDSFVYFIVDINGLKVVNDTYGHSAGDELIKGAAECLKKCLGAYGRIYRIGGDEFAAIVFADEKQLQFLENDLHDSAMQWKGELSTTLSFSVGVATKREFGHHSVTDIAEAADKRMYAAKDDFYKGIGIDRRGQQFAFAALCASYTKILKINITEDTYHIICMDVSEKTIEKGFSDTISAWLYNFGASGQIHPDDLKEYHSKTDIEYLRSYFGSNKRNLNIFYRRKSPLGYRHVKMEMLPSEDYKEESQILYLFVKDIDN